MSRRPARHSLCVACASHLVGAFPSMISRRTMRAPPIDRIILRSNFTLFLECENLSDHFIAKLAVSQWFAIHDRRSTWSACHPGLFRPGLLLRPSTPLNNPPTLPLLATALSHIHLPLLCLPSSFFSHSQLLSQPFSLLRYAFHERWQPRLGRGLVRACGSSLLQPARSSSLVSPIHPRLRWGSLALCSPAFRTGIRRPPWYARRAYSSRAPS